MPMLRMSDLASTAVALAVWLAGTPPARASCNTIPPVGGRFASDQGSVDRLLASPGDTVTVFAPTGTTFPAGSQAFVQVSGGTELPMGTLTRPADGITCTIPANPGAGRATITVREKSSTVVLAKIVAVDAKLSPLQGFVVLPAWNRLPAPDAPTSNVPTVIRATLDAAHSLLIPLEHAPATGSPPNHYGSFRRGLAKPFQAALKTHHENEGLVSIFTAEGRRLPPLAMANAHGLLVGVAKVTRGSTVRSVLRIDAATSGIDFTTYGTGPAPIEFASDKFALPTADAEAAVIDMRTFQSSRAAIAFTRERPSKKYEVVTVNLDGADIGQPVVTPQNRDALGPVGSPALAVSGTIVGALVERANGTADKGLQLWSVGSGTPNVPRTGAEAQDVIAHRRGGKRRGRRKVSLALEVEPASGANVAAWAAGPRSGGTRPLRAARPTGTAQDVAVTASTAAVAGGRVAWSGPSGVRLLERSTSQDTEVSKGGATAIDLSDDLVAWVTTDGRVCVRERRLTSAEQCSQAIGAADVEVTGRTVLYTTTAGGLFRFRSTGPEQIAASGVCEFVLGEKLLAYRKAAAPPCDATKPQPLWLMDHTTATTGTQPSMPAERLAVRPSETRKPGFEWMDPYLVTDTAVVYLVSDRGQPAFCVLDAATKRCGGGSGIGGPFALAAQSTDGVPAAPFVFEFAGREVLDLSSVAPSRDGVIPAAPLLLELR